MLDPLHQNHLDIWQNSGAQILQSKRRNTYILWVLSFPQGRWALKFESRWTRMLSRDVSLEVQKQSPWVSQNWCQSTARTLSPGSAHSLPCGMSTARWARPWAHRKQLWLLKAEALPLTLPPRTRRSSQRDSAECIPLDRVSLPLASNANTEALDQGRGFCHHGRCVLCMNCLGAAPITGWLPTPMSPSFSTSILCYLMARPRARLWYWAVSQTIEKHNGPSFRSSKSYMKVWKWMQWQGKSFPRYTTEKHHFLHLSQQFWPSARGSQIACSL